MEVIGFSKEEIGWLFELVATILKLGNMQFQEMENKNGSVYCKITSTVGKMILNFELDAGPKV